MRVAFEFAGLKRQRGLVHMLRGCMAVLAVGGPCSLAEAWWQLLEVLFLAGGQGYLAGLGWFHVRTTTLVEFVM